jgi:peptide deformylase
MNREIIKYPDPILRKKCQEVREVTMEIKKLVEEMILALEKKQGVGLSAPQVGVLKRVIVIETEKGPVGLINPKIIKKSRGKEVMEEGCLSFPGLWLKIKRAKEVEVEALDKEGKGIRMEAEGLIAKILQHEIDHLDGILFIDRLSLWQKLWRLLKS